MCGKQNNNNNNNNARWKEVLDSAVGGGFSLIQTLVEKMPDVAKVSSFLEAFSFA